jgi:hypothetical protein
MYKDGKFAEKFKGARTMAILVAFLRRHAEEYYGQNFFPEPVPTKFQEIVTEKEPLPVSSVPASAPAYTPNTDGEVQVLKGLKPETFQAAIDKGPNNCLVSLEMYIVNNPIHTIIMVALVVMITFLAVRRFLSADSADGWENITQKEKEKEKEKASLHYSGV